MTTELQDDGTHENVVQRKNAEITSWKDEKRVCNQEIERLRDVLLQEQRKTQDAEHSMRILRAKDLVPVKIDAETEQLRRNAALSDSQRVTAESNLTKSRDELQRVSDVLERNRLELQQKTTELATEKALRTSAEPYKTKLQEAVRRWLLSGPNTFTAQKVFDDEREYLSNEWGLSQALLDDERDGTRRAFPMLIDRLENYIKLTGSSDYQGDISTLQKDNYIQSEKINAHFKKYTNAY